MDEQTEILRSIWIEMKGLNSRIDKTNNRLDALRTELKEELHAEIGGLRRELHEEIGALRTELHEEIGGLRQEFRSELSLFRSQVVAGFGLVGDRIDNLLLGAHGQEHAEFRGRIARLETHVGLGPPVP